MKFDEVSAGDKNVCTSKTGKRYRFKYRGGGDGGSGGGDGGGADKIPAV